MNEHELIDKLKRIQALFVGATTDGERAAAEQAFERVRSRLRQERPQSPVEFKFKMPDHFQRRLFTALARRHGLHPYRYKGQRYTTVMLEVTPRFVREILWPEFTELSDTLHDYLDRVTDRVIAQAVHADHSDAAVAPELTGG